MPKKLFTKQEIAEKLRSLELIEVRRLEEEKRVLKKFKREEKKRLGVPRRPYQFDPISGPSHRIVGGKPVLRAPIKKEPEIGLRGGSPKFPPTP